MVILKAVAAGFGDGMELMVRKAAAEMAARGRECIAEFIVRIGHLIDTEDSLQAAFVEAAVMGDKRNSKVLERNSLADFLFQGCPDLREDRRIIRIFGSQSMDLLAPPPIIFRLRMDQAVERPDDLPILKKHSTDAAHTARLLVRRLKIYRDSSSHLRLFNTT